MGDDDFNPGMALCHAARTGNVSYMKRLQKDWGNELNINWQDGSGNTALHYTALQAQAEAAELLLDWDANTNLRNLQGDTPLHLASRKNNVKLINLLLQKGADKTLQNKKNVTAQSEVRSNEAKSLISAAITPDELDPDMLADIDDVDA
eukprot:TRINITY_DN12671_c0_g1_i1.p1 TRINITY_DN12671_c0_g1~~TRINITY_DN12671_c0_g1_i1.p1  ORF type:complete len:149 (-),score=51.92 TRINITY_DN12671_c0_g1_i1:175-621(-)